MKTLFRPDQDRWHKQEVWKKSAYAFVPFRTHFGELCGFADDIVTGGKGFGMHPHQEMEISTIVVAGAQLHRDSTGSEHNVSENMVQTMSAGTGIQHSEVNASKTKPVHSYVMHLPPNGVYIHCVRGQVHIAEQSLQSGDAPGIYDTIEPITIQAHRDSELIFVEVPVTRGIQL